MKRPKPEPPKPGELCGLRTGGWVCIAERHAPSDRHYFRKESRA